MPEKMRTPREILKEYFKKYWGLDDDSLFWEEDEEQLLTALDTYYKSQEPKRLGVEDQIKIWNLG